MSDIINALEDMPIPIILILAGFFFLLLAFVSRLGGFIEVQPTQQKWSAPIGIALVVVGLILSLNTESTENNVANTQPESTSSPTSTVEQSDGQGCAPFFEEGNILNWKVRDSRSLVNAGTLEIISVDSETGDWIGDQITETKKDEKIRLTGNLSNSNMELNHPNGAETWIGVCGDEKISGEVQTTYESQLTFEMQ